MPKLILANSCFPVTSSIVPYVRRWILKVTRVLCSLPDVPIRASYSPSPSLSPSFILSLSLSLSLPPYILFVVVGVRTIHRISFSFPCLWQTSLRDSNGPRRVCTENRRRLNIRSCTGRAAELKDKWGLARLYLNVQTLLLAKVHCFLPPDSGSRDLVPFWPVQIHNILTHRDERESRETDRQGKRERGRDVYKLLRWRWDLRLSSSLQPFLNISISTYMVYIHIWFNFKETLDFSRRRY